MLQDSKVFPSVRNSFVRAFTMIELVVFVSIMTLLGVLVFYYQSSSKRRTVEDSASAAYYTDMGFFLEHFHTDAKTATSIRPQTGGCILETKRNGNMSEISYKLEGEDCVVRMQDGSSKKFKFSRPEKDKLKFIFEIKEVTP